MFKGSLLVLILAWAAPGTCVPDSGRHVPTVMKQYEGQYPAEFAIEYDRVRLLTQQAQLEVSSKLGLINYREGFKYPIFIHFADAVPPSVENALAYVQLAQTSKGINQLLVVNLSLLSKHPMDFDKVFYHEMTHAVLNDVVGAEASVSIPHWLQEGLAMYVSGEGDARVQSAAEGYTKSRVSQLVFDLDTPVTGRAYPQYYLAVKYILDKHSINAVQGIVRQLVEGKVLPDAFQDATGVSLEAYKNDLRIYSLKIFKDIAKPDFTNAVTPINRF